MPTFNQRDSDGGYYIVARPPEAGIITYQVGSDADPIVEDYGLRSGEEISWEVIQALKAIRCISTNESGIIEPGDDFEPDPELLKEASLSGQEAESLLDSIQKHHDLSQEELDVIYSVLGIEPPGIDTGRVQNSLSQEVSSLIESEKFPIESTLKYDSLDEISVAPLVQRSEDQDRSDDLKISVNLISTSDIDNSEDLNLLCHSINVSHEQGIDEWLIGFSDTRSWDVRSEITQQVSHLLPIFISELKSLGIDPGAPEELPGPTWRDFEDVTY